MLFIIKIVCILVTSIFHIYHKCLLLRDNAYKQNSYYKLCRERLLHISYIQFLYKVAVLSNG